MNKAIRTITTCLFAITVVIVFQTAKSWGQSIPASEIENYLAYYDSLGNESSSSSGNFSGADSTSGYRVHMATPGANGAFGTNSYGNFDSFGGFGTSQFGGYSNVYGGGNIGYGGGAGGSGYGYDPYSTQIYQSGDMLRSDPGGGIGGTIIRKPVPVIQQAPMIMVPNNFNQSTRPNLSMGPPIPVNAKSMSATEKREFAAKFSPEIQSMLRKLDSEEQAFGTMSTTMDATSPAVVQKRASLEILEQELDDKADAIATAISEFASRNSDSMNTQSMQTQGINSGIPYPNSPYLRPTAIEGPNYWFDIR